MADVTCDAGGKFSDAHKPGLSGNLLDGDLGACSVDRLEHATSDNIKTTPSAIMQIDKEGSVSNTGSIDLECNHNPGTVEAHATEAHSPSPAVENDKETSAVSPPEPSLPSDSQRPSTPSPSVGLLPGERRQRPRSALEFRSANRLSGFLTNLMHRRDPASSLSSQSQMLNDLAAEPGSSSEIPVSDPVSSRPVTPPPPLPPPTLQELGLSLSSLTSDLSPSHFTSTPTSGAFLGPCYLLLCHAQGLDVLPMVSPPALQPYALVRRVSFKSVVVMEQRGVLVAIAGRRDGVRVYALDEIKKAVDWRMDVEIRREREKSRREATKKPITPSPDIVRQVMPEKKIIARSLTPPPSSKNKQGRRFSVGTPPRPPSSRGSTPTQIPSQLLSPLPPLPHTTIPSPPLGRPPPYSATSSPPTNLNRLASRPSLRSISVSNTRPESVVDVLAGRRNTDSGRDRNSDAKDDWKEGRDSSDDEAINVVAAGASGSQALDERTSSRRPPPSLGPGTSSEPMLTLAPQRSHTDADQPANSSSNNPAQTSPRVPPQALAQSLLQPIGPETSNLTNIDDDDNDHNVPPSERITLSQALMESRAPYLPPPGTRIPQQAILIPSRNVSIDDDDIMEENSDSNVSLSQMLMESRLPDIPPPGTRVTQEPIMINATQREDDSTRSGPPASGMHSDSGRNSRRGRDWRRWTLLSGIFSNGTTQVDPSSMAELTAAVNNSQVSTGQTTPRNASQPGGAISNPSTTSVSRTSDDARHGNLHDGALTRPILVSSLPISSPTHSRFLPRIISNALHTRRTDDNPHAMNSLEDEPLPRFSTLTTAQTAPPKLEYVKLPGTKGALSIKAVETAKKSFLAILCGDAGEKVELFAGTYRTALGLSRTFILPDSPRSLELQLQGDDLVEVFLMFPQNVFGLEPATVRVREVRIGRAERRAARRRARELRSGEAPLADNDLNLPDDDVNINTGVTLSVTSESASNDDAVLVPAVSPEGPVSQALPSSGGNATTSSLAPEDLLAVSASQMGPYTTFQQLSFAPNIPLASIADDYIIPPTYAGVIQYRDQYEVPPTPPTANDQSQMQFKPPGLPIPTPTPPSRWFYRDPKGKVHGPWKASLMQAWYKDGLLPPDLPVKREEETDYTMLKDLRLQSVDPTHPFKSPPPPKPQISPISHDSSKPLLHPISLLAQPRHFGPPALFFSSRGGHSTAIVDARGRSVLKCRFVWSEETDASSPSSPSRMGDIKRLEAFDIKDRSVLVALRQGGLEAMDLGDALLRPADASRTELPQFITPSSNMSRRAPFVWRMGTSISTLPSMLSLHQPKGASATATLRRSGMGSGKSGKASESGGGDTDSGVSDEVLYLGRKDDEMYICERNAGAFRILRLSPTV